MAVTISRSTYASCRTFMVPHRPRALLSSSFAFRNPTLFFARARLYEDRLELTGWHLHGRYRRILATEQVLQVDVLNEHSLLLWLSTGETLRLRIHDAPRWKKAVEQQTYLPGQERYALR